MTPLNLTDRLSVALEVQQWNQLLILLQQVSAPYQVTAPIIQAVHEQLTGTQQERADNVVSMGENA